jgi:hypothetical protein
MRFESGPSPRRGLLTRVNGVGGEERRLRRPSHDRGSCSEYRFLYSKSWIPAAAGGASCMVARLTAGWQEHVCPAFGPLHRLVIHQAFTEHVGDRRLHKRRRNRLSVPIPPATVGMKPRLFSIYVRHFRTALVRRQSEGWCQHSPQQDAGSCRRLT